MSVLGTGSVVDRYQIDGILGRGGMAVVYRARHRQLGTPCALKVLTHASPAIQTRLVQEGKIQATLTHPNVVRVYDVVAVDGAPGLVMELVNGPSLDNLLARHALSVEQADEIAGGIIAGVGAAHALGLVHRDLKPANVLMQLTAAGPIPKVADFGLAKLTEGEGGDVASRTRSGMPMGTPAYMAPEQIRDAKSVDHRADIFAIGAILYQLVTGRRAFPDDDIVALYSAIAEGRFTPPRTLRPDLPERMERAILGAMHTRREERIQDCATLLQTWRGLDASSSSGGVWSAALLSEISQDAPARAEATSLPDEVSLDAGEHRRETRTFGATNVEASRPVWSLRSVSQAGEPAGLDPVRVALVLGAGLTVGVILVAAAAAGFSGFKAYRAIEPVSAEPAPVVEAPVVAPAPEPVVAAPEPVAVQPAVEAPKPVLKRTAAPAPVVAPEPVPEPVVAVAPEPTPAPSPPPPPPPVPESLPEGVARVTISGDASSVWLQGAPGNFRLPSNVPPGTYKVQAYFSDERPTTVTELRIAAGETRALKCVAAARTCR